MATTQTYNAVSGIDHRDKIIAPNDRLYRVRDIYVDSEGTQRAKLRHSPRRQMYVPLHRLNHLVANTDWSYVRTNE